MAKITVNGMIIELTLNEVQALINGNSTVFANTVEPETPKQAPKAKNAPRGKVYSHGREYRKQEKCTQTKSAKTILANACKKAASAMVSVETECNGAYMWIYPAQGQNLDDFKHLELSKKWRLSKGDGKRELGFYVRMDK